jgi:hypothetical protein
MVALIDPVVTGVDVMQVLAGAELQTQWLPLVHGS